VQDIYVAYYLVQIREGEESKTTYWIYYRLLEYNIMLFGLTNALPNFQAFIYDILYLFLDIFLTTYFDNILIYSNCYAEHHAYIK
jgi:hypothetical protein